MSNHAHAKFEFYKEQHLTVAYKSLENLITHMNDRSISMVHFHREELAKLNEEMIMC